MSNTITEQDENAYFIALITGVTPDNDDFWCYLAIPFEKYELYKLVEQQGDFDMEDYGLGRKPPPDIKKAMTEKYKLDNNFENKLSVITGLLDD